MNSSEIVALSEQYLFNNFKFYLMKYGSCLLDILLEVQDDTSPDPMTRYKDFTNALEQHMGLGSYVTGQPAQYTKTPYLTVNIKAIPMGNCNTRVVMGFDIVWSTDTPPAPDNVTKYVGSSAESVAAFRADMVTALNDLMYRSWGEEENDPWKTQAFFDVLRNQMVTNPTNPNEGKKWTYNIRGQVDGNVEISEVFQLKTEDRYVGLNLFHVIYNIDIYELWDGERRIGC